MNNKKVQILLSTYNGDKYLVEQIQSILNQKYVNLELLIRDDGSKNATIDILSKYNKLPNVKIIQEQNLGVPQCFFRLLQLSSQDAEYFAFCDQDDVWLTDKISRAIQSLENIPEHTPSMYCSRLNLVDENLNFLGTSFLPKQQPSFKNAIVGNVATGCTMVINRQTKQLVLKQIPQRVAMHDWWIYIVVSALGKVVVDDEAKILYRQHTGNEIGMNSTLINRWKQRITRLIARDPKYALISAQAEELLNIYTDILPKENFKIIQDFVYGRKTIIDRFKYALRGKVKCQSFLDNLAFRILIVLNYI